VGKTISTGWVDDGWMENKRFPSLCLTLPFFPILEKGSEGGDYGFKVRCRTYRHSMFFLFFLYISLVFFMVVVVVVVVVVRALCDVPAG